MQRPRKMPRQWRIAMVSEQKAKSLRVVVTASDEEAAIERACEKFSIADTLPEDHLAVEVLGQGDAVGRLAQQAG